MSTSVLSLAAYQRHQLREAYRQLAHAALEDLLVDWRREWTRSRRGCPRCSI